MLNVNVWLLTYRRAPGGEGSARHPAVQTGNGYICTPEIEQFLIFELPNGSGFQTAAYFQGSYVDAKHRFSEQKPIFCPKSKKNPDSLEPRCIGVVKFTEHQFQVLDKNPYPNQKNGRTIVIAEKATPA